MKRGINWFFTNYTWNFIQTSIHKYWVMHYLFKYCIKTRDKRFFDLLRRGLVHDFSKLGNKESLFFADEIFNLKNLTYGTPEYKAALDKIKPCLDHHYAHNRHHPEYHPHGYKDMLISDKIEMIPTMMITIVITRIS